MSIMKVEESLWRGLQEWQHPSNFDQMGGREASQGVWGRGCVMEERGREKMEGFVHYGKR